MQITRTNPFNGNVNTRELDISPEQVYAYESCGLIQDAFPNLSSDDREF